MKRFRKTIGLLTIFCLMVLAGCNQEVKLRGSLDMDLEDFSYINQNGEKFGKNDLKGKVWVSDFIFTNCTTVCSPMTANMAKLQKMAKDEGLDVEFVSFSVDPEVDSPEVLKTFVGKFTDDTSNWNLLTGYSFDHMKEFAKNNFKTLVDKPEGQDQVMHGTKFYLIDQKGLIVKEYSGISNTPYEEILRDIERLTR
ncbi:cysteine ABC transporter ATP-binding protein [Bacillus manliponensis]|uniref:Cysteine ABC transporter ATP-binding protein n=1 Tax=Bacillus manliponensis TaxID=574376 RepID=A0A073JVT7_9BACI|nr:SCO family protein [Bacillus manliponensis]KEK18332.1 cysteine ABC transporter ATP-binding protein [Bacillus manliponensis]